MENRISELFNILLLASKFLFSVPTLVEMWKNFKPI